MTGSSFWTRSGPIGPDWELGETPDEAGRWTLIGWDEVPGPIDGGPTPIVAGIWSRALSRVARVTFPVSLPQSRDSIGWVPSGEDLMLDLGPAVWTQHALAKLAGKPLNLVLLSTRRAESIASLFSDARFPWWLQSQVALLSAIDGPAPGVNRATLLAALEKDWARSIRHTMPMGVQAVIRPGVDGDVAGLLGLAGDLDDRILAALEMEARETGWSWSMLD